MSAGLDASEVATASLLWEAGRLTTRVDAVRAALPCADPDRLVSLAQAHGLTGMLWRALANAGCTGGLGEASAPLEEQARLHRLEHLVLLPHAVETAIQPLLDAGLEPVVFKGPSLAARYPEPGLRPMLDIDVVLPRADHARAVRAATAAGWSVVIPADRDHYETVLSHRAVPTLLLEIHRGLDTWFQRSAEIDLDELWMHRVSSDCFGTPAFGLPAELEFAALAAHAGKPFHTFSRLIWAVDLTVVATPTLDWGVVVGWAESWHCRTMLALALRQAERLGLAVPGELTAVRASKLRGRVLDPVGSLDWPLESPSLEGRNRLRYALADRWTRRLVLFAGLPAPAPVHTWPRRYAVDLWRGGRRATRLWRQGRATGNTQD